ncbi:unnamed protein product [Brassica oleracea]
MGSCFSIQISGDSVLDRVGSCLCGEGNHILNLEKNLVALEKAMVELKARRDDVLTRVRFREAKDNREKCIVRAGVGLCEVPEVEKWSAVERMSLMNNKVEKISGSPNCPKLTTLFLQENRRLGSISGEFFMCMPKVVVLDLSHLPLCGLPEEISDWKELLLLKDLEVLTIEIESELVLEKLFFSHMGRRCIQKVVIIGIPEISVKGQLEEVVSREKADELQVQDIIPFGNLETLAMLNLPAVKSIYWAPLPFPCLREMTIDRCPSLAKLPLDSKSVAEVERFVIKCEAADWIERIEWEDKATRLRFLPSRRKLLSFFFFLLPLCQLICIETSRFCKRCGCVLECVSYSYIHKHGYKSKLMAAAVLQSLKDSPAFPDDEKYSFVRKLSPDTATHYNFTNKELIKWDHLSLASAIMGPCTRGAFVSWCGRLCKPS